jgi:nitroreductase
MRGFSVNDQQLMETITQRRSVRKYKNQPFPMEELIKLVEAARWAPSAGNSQPWEFLLINDEDMVSGLKAVSPGWLKPAPALIVICINKNRETDWSQMDVGAAMQNILLCAHSRGVGCCPIGSFSVETVKELLDIPPDLKPVLFMTVGYPDEKPTVSERLSVDKLIFKKVGK